MFFWTAAALLFIVFSALVVLRGKKRQKKKVRATLIRPALNPSPFEIINYGDTSAEPNDTKHAVEAYNDYLRTYKKLLADRANKQSANSALDQFIRSNFPSDVLYGYLAVKLEENLATSVRQGMITHWGAGPLGEAALLAFRRSGEIRYLELFKQFFDRLMMLRDSELGYYDDYHEQVINAWGAYNLGRNAGKPGLWVAHVTHFSVVMLPATGFARDILGNPTLATYHDWATSIVNYFEEGYRQFDTEYRDVAGTAEKWYWRPLLNKYEATNHMHLQGQALLNMYAVTKSDLYADRIRGFLRIFEEGVTLHDDGLASWKYSPYFQVENEKNGHISRQFSEYTWKGEITVPFLYEAKAEGFAIRPDTMNGVTSSIRDHILKDAEYKLHVHPQGSRPISARDRKKATLIEAGISGYHAAASIDPHIAQQVIDVVAKSPQHFPQGWLSHPKLSRSYARLLASSEPDTPAKPD